MQIKCTHCQRAINIPDEKLPKGQAFNITCPGCKSKIRVDQHLTPSAPAPGKTPSAEPKSAKPKEETVNAPQLSISDDFDDDEDELVVYDENDRLALILDEENKAAWTRVLEESGYKFQYAKSPEHAVHKMKFTQFHLVALHENFGHVSLEESAVYQSLLEMPMELRRNIFVALIGKNFKTLNNMQAYQYSVNVVINIKDLGKLSDILRKAIKENEMFYKVFKETLKAMGKA